MERLSQYLLEKAEEFEADVVADFDEEFQDEIRESERLAKRLTKKFVHARFGFGDEGAATVEKWLRIIGFVIPDLTEQRLDHFYCTELLKLAPRMVKRTMRLSVIVPLVIPSGPARVYLSEATRSYVFGFWQSSVALSRAAVEEALRQFVKQRLRLTRAPLPVLVENAIRLNLLDEARGRMAAQVEGAGNRLLHGEPTNERDAWDTLCSARGVLEHLYAG